MDQRGAQPFGRDRRNRCPWEMLAVSTITDPGAKSAATAVSRLPRDRSDGATACGLAWESALSWLLSREIVHARHRILDRLKHVALEVGIINITSSI